MPISEEGQVQEGGSMPMDALSEGHSVTLAPEADEDIGNVYEALGVKGHKGRQPSPLRSCGTVSQLDPVMQGRKKVLSVNAHSRYQSFVRQKQEAKAAKQQLKGAEADASSQSMQDVTLALPHITDSGKSVTCHPGYVVAEPPTAQEASDLRLSYDTIDKLGQFEETSEDDASHILLAADILAAHSSTPLPEEDRATRHRYVEACKALLVKAHTVCLTHHMEDDIVAVFNALIDGYGK